MEETCAIQNCQEKPRHTSYKFQKFCPKHYDELMLKDLEHEWACWEVGTIPTHNLLNLLGRLLEEGKLIQKNGSISRARIRDRGFNFQKFDRSCTFEITRHPGAFKNGYVNNRVVQKWSVSLQDGCVEFLEERPWTSKDPDR